MKTVGNRDAGTKTAIEVVRIKEFGVPYQHKVVDGPIPVNTVFYPTLGDDDKVRTMAVTVKDPFHNIFSPLVDMDRAIKKKEVLNRTGNTAEANKVRSSLSATTTYHCLILDKADEVPLVKRAEYPYSVYKAMVDTEIMRAVNSRMEKDESKLRYGLLFMIWFEIMRVEKGTSKDPRFNTGYTVRVLDKYIGGWENKIPAFLADTKNVQMIDEDNFQFIIKTPTKEFPIPVVEYGMLTEEEFNAIVNYEHQLTDLTIPMTDDLALEKLHQYPIMLDARDQQGNFYLPDWKQFAEKLEEHRDELPFILSSSVKMLPSAEIPEELPDELPESTPETHKPKKSLENLFDETEEAEVVEVEEKPVEEPAKKRGRPAKASFDELFNEQEKKEPVKKEDIFKSLV